MRFLISIVLPIPGAPIKQKGSKANVNFSINQEIKTES